MFLHFFSELDSGAVCSSKKRKKHPRALYFLKKNKTFAGAILKTFVVIVEM